MSVEVVNRAASYEVECPFCKSVLRFAREDVKQDFHVHPMIYCPVCKEGIEVAYSGGELMPNVEPIFTKEAE